MLEVISAAQLRELVGSEAAVSPWMEIAQPRVNTFADATSDHQWIHVDAERCARESPFGAPVAHGFLTLSLLPAMFESAVTLRNFRMVLNYGLNKVRFPAPVPVGSRVRARLVLQACEEIEGGTQLVWDVAVEREGATKPVCVAEFVMRGYL
jgi:acyl dehydratase